YLMLSINTFGEGMQRAIKYLRLVSDALNMRLEQDERGARVVVKGSAINAPQLRHTEILVAHQVIRFGQTVTEGRYAPRRVRLRTSRRSPQEEYDATFGCPVEFEGS